jgi:hypothetical protein
VASAVLLTAGSIVPKLRRVVEIVEDDCTMAATCRLVDELPA